jgi:hypothetical protein
VTSDLEVRFTMLERRTGLFIFLMMIFMSGRARMSFNLEKA